MQTLLTWWASALFLSVLCADVAAAQPRMKWTPKSHFGLGDSVGESFVLDESRQKRRLAGLIRPDTRVAVVVFFGGGMKERPDDVTKRGPLWCEDSFDDLAVQRALVHAFENEPVQFIGIAVPPVYHAARYGWPQNPFLESAEESEAYSEAVRSFIQRTQIAVQEGYLPYDVYFDPRNRLAQNPAQQAPSAAAGPVYDWQGKFRWPSDARRYGTPTLWFLDGSGRVIAEPLLGNDYDGSPPEINYGFQSVKGLIEGLLQSAPQ